MRASSAIDAWTIHRKPKAQARLRLFCLPYAGAGASLFHSWSSQLPPQIEVWPIQLPGREDRLSEPAFTQLPPLVEALGSALRPHLNVPFAFFGHSMGALISFELARYLRERYQAQPVHLCVAACSAPQFPISEPPIHDLPEAEFLAELRRLNGTVPEALCQPELMEMLLPVLRADFAIRASYTYVPQAPLACPIAAFGGLQDQEIRREELVGWQVHTQAAFTLRMLPGDHFFLHNNRTLLQMISYNLMQSLAARGGSASN